MEKNVMYEVHEAIGNFSQKVFESLDFYEVQDYLLKEFQKAVNNGDFLETDEDMELFYSYFAIIEVNN